MAPSSLGLVSCWVLAMFRLSTQTSGSLMPPHPHAGKARRTGVDADARRRAPAKHVGDKQPGKS